MDINQVLNNKENNYFGHGTGTADDKTIQSIMLNGLRCSHGSLYFTSVGLGRGTEIDNVTQNMLRNWPHKNSDIIVIVSLPAKYKIIDLMGTGTYNLGDAAFYYTPDEDKRNEYSLTNSPYVMPEFIVGYYDASNDTFTENPRYYERLDEKEQEQLFSQVKDNYFNIVNDGWDIEEYKEVCMELGWEFGLSDEELKSFKDLKKSEQILSQFIPETLNKKLKLPTGIEIDAKEYMQKVVLPFIPADGYIFLNNGAKLPITHFLLECVLYDCQERYDGDFAHYMQDNVDFEKTFKQNEKNK